MSPSTALWGATSPSSTARRLIRSWWKKQGVCGLCACVFSFRNVLVCLPRVGSTIALPLMCNLWHFLLMFSFRKSFFSGHASFAMYTMLYLAVSHVYFYTHTHARKHTNKHTKQSANGNASLPQNKDRRAWSVHQWSRLWFCDFLTSHYITLSYVCIIYARIHSRRETENTSELTEVLVQAWVSWPIRAEWA